jgi:hypothetical protein
MKRIVTLDAAEWDRLPARIAEYLAAEARKLHGFSVIGKDSGDDFDRDGCLDHFLRGLLEVGMSDLFPEDKGR